MDTIPTTRAERELPDLIHRASAGETIVIEAPSGERVRLEPLPRSPERGTKDRSERTPGRLKGKLTVPARLMEPMSEEELAEWYGKPD
jgi:antitoxin (DNA-binding transcriptional repressor) of toxin-antitoxin stability system